ncbi:MAG: phasin family protein [Pseudomonadota bacterium]
MATAKKTEKTETPEVKEAAKTTVAAVRENVTERVSAARETVMNSADTVRGVSTQASGAAVDFGKAYYSGLTTLGQTLWGFGQEFYGEVSSHATKTFQARSLKQVAELQAAFAQTRIENSAAHGKEFIDVARVQAEQTIKPIVELLDGKRAA